ncbi:hypothetical protein HELRODRAFT_185528 [Helobdella robusta]|uniref:Citramalyl-CoA lyase, mitochondrial n=1 Tax=Helobdella robusta TaxID=6412 RepID=T1FMX7_HELRO|nr:hypothetical protein HELRODRAFT_185528 [Helobdella robusta]ESO04931.1 hypothetical protein HELRODRAFT_185528 [Helobdella robusta]
MFARHFKNLTFSVSRLNSPKCFSKVPIKADPIFKKYVPRRAVLYVPGSDERKISKIPNLDADCVVLDCEDGVAVSSKEAARVNIKKTLDTLHFGRTEPIVRINSVSSGLGKEDLQVVLSASNLPPTLMLPKVEMASNIEWLAETVVSILEGMNKEKHRMFNLIIFIESALGLLNFENICRRSVELMELGVPLSLEGVVFGSDDFCANIGAERTKDAIEIMYARQKVVLVAKAFQMQAIDLVHIDFKDLEGLRQQSLEGARMGFTGKQVIHPTQVPVVQECFTPSAQRIDWATRLIAGFNEHQAQGKGAFVFEGSMIDMPLLKQAQNIVQLVESLKKVTIPESQAATEPASETAKKDATATNNAAN